MSAGRTGGAARWIVAGVGVILALGLGACVVGLRRPVGASPSPTPAAGKAAPKPAASPAAAPQAPAAMPPAPTHRSWEVLSEVHTRDKIAALTIDLGETARREAVDSLMAYTAKHHVPVTWFVTGWFARNLPDLLDKIARRGDGLGNHTDTHPHCRSVSRARLRQELKNVEELLRRRGLQMTPPKYFRPPFGEYNAAVVSTAREIGYRSVMWSATSLDYEPSTPPDRAARTILKHLQPGGIILCHATNVSKVAIPAVIGNLERRGYHMVSLQEVEKRGG